MDNAKFYRIYVKGRIRIGMLIMPIRVRQNDVDPIRPHPNPDPQHCLYQDVTGYPTLKFFKTGYEKDDGVKYRGDRWTVRPSNSYDMNIN